MGYGEYEQNYLAMGTQYSYAATILTNKMELTPERRRIVSNVRGRFQDFAFFAEHIITGISLWKLPRCYKGEVPFRESDAWHELTKGLGSHGYESTKAVLMYSVGCLDALLAGNDAPINLTTDLMLSISNAYLNLHQMRRKA